MYNIDLNSRSPELVCLSFLSSYVSTPIAFLLLMFQFLLPSFFLCFKSYIAQVLLQFENTLVLRSVLKQTENETSPSRTKIAENLMMQPGVCAP